MSDAVTLTALLAKGREYGEIDDDYWDDTVLTGKYNDAKTELWDRILAAPNGRDFLLKPSRRIPVAVSRSGTGDSIAITGVVCTLTDSAGAFLDAEVGKMLHISGCTNPDNDGSFVITSRTSTTVSYENAEGVAETTALTWRIDSETVGLPSDYGVDVEKVQVLDSDSKWQTLFPLNLHEASDDTVETPSSKYMTRYRVVGRTLMLSPTPSWAGYLRIWYVPRPVDLSTGTDTAEFFFGWDRFCHFKVCQWHARARGETAEANAFRDDAAIALDGILSRCIRRTAAANTIRDVYGERRRGKRNLY